MTERRGGRGREGAITAGFGVSTKMSERKASAAELLASIVEELRTGSVEAERVGELAGAAAKLLGGRPPPPELVEGLVRCGLTVKEITGVLGPLGVPEQAMEAGAPAAAASIKQLTCVPGLLGELIEWNVRTARYPSRVMALAAAIAVVGKLLDRKVAGANGVRNSPLHRCARADWFGKAASIGCRQDVADDGGNGRLDWAGRLFIGASAATADQREELVHFGDG